MNSEFMLIRLDFTFDFSGPKSHGAVTLCEKPDFTFNISSISRSRLCGAKNISLFLMRWVANGWVLTFPQSREVGKRQWRRCWPPVQRPISRRTRSERPRSISMDGPSHCDGRSVSSDRGRSLRSHRDLQPSAACSPATSSRWLQFSMRTQERQAR